MKILLSAGLGAATMYFLDPARGRYRRALARARFEHGRETVTHGVHKATHGLNTARHRARAVGRDVSHRADKVMHGVRTIGHDIGDRADQVTQGAVVVGREARDRAAGAAATVGSFFERSPPHNSVPAETRGNPRAKILMIPVTWLVTVGLGAAVMYYLDPSHGRQRRALVRDRFARWRRQSTQSASIDGRDMSRDAAEPQNADEVETAEQQRSGNGSGRHSQDQNRPLPG